MSPLLTRFKAIIPPRSIPSQFHRHIRPAHGFNPIRQGKPEPSREQTYMIIPTKSLKLSTILVSAALFSPMYCTSPAFAHAYTPAYCESYARDVSWRYSRGGAVGGAVRGGAGGAAVGAIVGGKHGAKKGAAIGAVAGGTARAVQRSVTYDQIYRDCMRGYFPY